MKRVAIVNDGGFLSMSAANGDYDEWIKIIKDDIDEMMSIERRSGEAKSGATTRVVNSLKELDAELHAGNVDVAIFVTQGLLKEARDLQRRYPKLRVLLYTGLIPRGEVIILPKAAYSRRQLRHLAGYP